MMPDTKRKIAVRQDIGHRRRFCGFGYPQSRARALTLMEIIVSLAIMAIIFAVIVPLFVTMRNSWDSKQAAAEALQNGRVLIDHLNRNLSKAVRVSAVSDSAETNGYIEFEDNDGNNARYDVNGTGSYVEFGLVGDLSDLAGPVSQLQFTCYDACDFNTPITDVESIRFVKVQTTLTNPAALGQDKTLIASAYLRTNWNTSGGGSQVTYEEFTEKKRSSGGSSLTIDTPSGTSEGDLLVAAVVTDWWTVSSLAPPVGEGWMEINLDQYSNAVTLGVWWKLADASESPSHQFTWSGSVQAYGWIMRFTGHDPTDPIDDWATDGESSSTPTSPAVTATVDNCLILRLGAFDDDDITVDDPGLSGHTAITMDESNLGSGTCSGGAGYIQQPSIGDSGTSSFSLTAKEQYRAVTIAIAPDPEGGGGGGGQILP